MSKRFGRTQKNKMRAKIAELESALEYAGQLNRELMLQVEESRDRYQHLGNSIRRYAKHSDLIDPERIFSEYYGGEWSLPVQQQINLAEIAQTPEATALLHHVNLECIRVMGENNWLQRMLHVKVVHPDGVVAYNLSRDAWEKGDIRHAEDFIVKQVAYELIRLIREKRSDAYPKALQQDDG